MTPEAKAYCEKQAQRIAELEQQRDVLLAAAENLVKVKGRHHTETAYKALEATVRIFTSLDSTAPKG